MAESSSRERPDDFDDHNPQKRTKLDEDNLVDANAIVLDVDLETTNASTEKQDDMVVDTEGVQNVEIVVVSETEQEIDEDPNPNQKSDTDPKLQNFLPPSRILLGANPSGPTSNPEFSRTTEVDVGISEYVSHDVPPIHGVIKQRCVVMACLRRIAG